MEHDRRPCRAGGEGGQAPDRPRFRSVGVEDVRPQLPDQLGDSKHRAGIVQERDLALDLRNAHDGYAEPVGEEGHRVLAARQAPGDECRVVAAALEPGCEVCDVDRRPAHVEPRDDTQHADRLGCHGSRTLAEHAEEPRELS